MILLLDIGNTRAKMAWMTRAQSKWLKGQAMALDHGQLAGLATYVPCPPQAILASNVAGPPMKLALEQYCQNAWGLEVQWQDTRHGRHLLQNSYQEPSRLGTDRWLAMLGLLQHVREREEWKHGSPCLLASFGTATTIDTLLPPGNETTSDMPLFAGGLILPGYRLMGSSLAQATAQLPFPQGQSTNLPRNTHDAIASGIAAAQSGALLRQWRHSMQPAKGRAPLVFVSGGAWDAVHQDVEVDLMQAQADMGLATQAPVYIESPVLDGLASLWPA